MPWPDDDIPALVKGERPTLLEAETGNEVVTAINTLGNISITRGYGNGDGEVIYDSDGVTIVVEDSTLFAPNGEFTFLDATDLTKKIEVVFLNGVIQSVTVVESEWIEKEIVICEDGSEETYTFLVKSTEPP